MPTFHFMPMCSTTGVLRLHASGFPDLSIVEFQIINDNCQLKLRSEQLNNAVVKIGKDSETVHLFFKKATELGPYCIAVLSFNIAAFIPAQCSINFPISKPMLYFLKFFRSYSELSTITSAAKTPLFTAG